MSARDWPKGLAGNQFSLQELDPSIPPERIKVNTWSDVFRDGGSVSVDAYFTDDAFTRTTLATIQIDENRHVAEERDWLQDLVDDFTTDLEVNWAALINDARAKCLAYYTSQRDEAAEKIAALTSDGSPS